MGKNRLTLLFGIFLVLSALILVSADIGPHNAASLTFGVTYNNASISESFDATLLACSDTDCKEDNHALCTNGICKFSYYRVERVPPKMKLLFELNDETFSSEIIEFSSTQPVLFYDIDITLDNKLIVTPFPPEESSIGSLVVSLILALALTVIIELIVLIIFLRKWKVRTDKWKKPVISLIIADIISVPFVWIIFFFLLIMFSVISLWAGALLSIFIAEISAVVFEAYFIYWLNKKIITLKRSFILSIVMNIASFLIGGIVLTILLSRL